MQRELIFFDFIMKDFLRKILPPSFIYWTYKARAYLACLLYRFPSRKLTVIGVTGTNGKTTTCNLIATILTKAGYKVGLATTINFRIQDKEWENTSKMTTLSPFVLQRLLRQMVKAECDYAVIETTSHAIDQFRVWGIAYDIAILTNITPEHLDYHKSMVEYKQVKSRLFSGLIKGFRKPGIKKISILNRDDPSYSEFRKIPADIQLSYKINRTSGDQSQITASNIDADSGGSSFLVSTPYGEIDIKLKLPGKFNISNSLAAITAATSQNISLPIIKHAIEGVLGVSGRMQRIDIGQEFDVVVDFAHTPDALEKVYSTLKPLVQGKIIAVLGATGERYKSKRPIMGALAGRWADIVFVTNEDPYHEDPWDIIRQVATGVPRGAEAGQPKIEGQNFFKVLDRHKAIENALAKAQKGDLVIITGKGGEKVMAIGDKKIPWDEAKIVEEMLKKMIKSQ